MSPADKLATARRAHIPTGARRVVPKAGGVEFWLWEADTPDGRRAFALAFVGRARKPAWRYRFRSEAQRQGKLAAEAEAAAARVAYKAKASAPHGWSRGLILVASWGYDQTNVDAYEVVSVVGPHTVEVEQIGTVRATDDTSAALSMSEKVVPDPTARTGKITRHRVRNGAIASPVYGSAAPWHGMPLHCSWYA